MQKDLLDKLTGDPEKDFKTLKQIWLLWKTETGIKEKLCFGCTVKYAIEWLTNR